jgi:hypothetical protein
MIDPHKVEAVKEMPRPADVEAVQRLNLLSQEILKTTYSEILTKTYTMLYLI